MPVGTQELLAVVAPRFEEVVTRSAERAVTEIPSYSDTPAADVRVGIARDLALCMTALTEQRELTEEERATMGIIGRERAEQGRPVDAMLRVYRITFDEVFGVLWDAAENGSLAAADVVRLTRMAWHYAGPMLEIAVRSYRDRELALTIADSQRRTEVVHKLLLSSSGAGADVATAIGLDPAVEHLAFRARAVDGDTRPLLLDLQLPGALQDGVVALLDGDVVGVAARRPPTPTVPGVIVGVGPLGALHEIARSYTVATRVLDTAQAFGRTGVWEIESLAFETLARSETLLAHALHAKYIEPLEPATPSGAEHVAAIRALLEHDLSAEAAAEALHVHPNTVRNRLRRFEQKTGVSLQSVTVISELRLALLHAESTSRQ